jgi:hypothetical protein
MLSAFLSATSSRAFGQGSQPISSRSQINGVGGGGTVRPRLIFKHDLGFPMMRDVPFVLVVFFRGGMGGENGWG